jgi:UDP-GlcNAc:undecaprenyl-phosphate/decaprenyl-phosphate GlcNAc-1-phosphate transferase
MISMAASFVLAALLAAWGTPVARGAALRFGIVDRPDGALKRQQEPVPYLGGLAIFLAFLVALALVYEFDRQVLGLLLAGTLVVLLGLIDDLGALSPGVKLLGQLVACWVLIKSDVMTHIVALPFWANALLTVAWVLTATNAMNLVDILDGLAPGIALVAALGLVAATAGGEAHTIPVMAAALAGALLGFLPHNHAPARIYLGDSGSLFLGLMLGALTLTASYTANNRLGFVSPLWLLGLPLFDTAFVSAVRISRGASPFRGSPDHFPLRLRRRGWSVRRVAITCWVGSAALGGLALLNTQFHDPAATLALLAATGLVAAGFAGWLLWMDGRDRRLSGRRKEKGIRSRAADRATSPQATEGGAGR